MRTNRSRSGFTLIEVLIVVIIMAILAATVIPQFTSSTKDARQSAMAFNQSSVRSQIELYKAQHLGVLPTIVSGLIPQLTGVSDVNGNTNATNPAAPDATKPFGPYMDQLPANPFNALNTFEGQSLKGSSTAPNPDGTTGWIMDTDTGIIWPNNTTTASN